MRYLGRDIACSLSGGLEFSESMFKCVKDDPNNARNEETENRSVEMPIRRFIKVTVT